MEDSRTFELLLVQFQPAFLLIQLLQQRRLVVGHRIYGILGFRQLLSLVAMVGLAERTARTEECQQGIAIFISSLVDMHETIDEHPEEDVSEEAAHRRMRDDE